jgi:hypothetical protein
MKRKHLIFLCFLFTSINYAQRTKIVCPDSLKVIDIDTYFDYYKKEVKGHEIEIIMKKRIFTEEFSYGKKGRPYEFYLNIEITTDGSYILEKASSYLPKDTEILLLLENEDRDFLGGNQQLKFRIGREIKQLISNKKINPIYIIEFLKCNLIKLKKIRDDDYFLEAFENEVNKTK